MNDLLNISLQDISQEALLIMHSLHFVRSEWFYAFIPLLLFLFFSYRTRLNSRNWQGVIDQQLLPYVLTETGKKQRRYPLLLVLIAGSLCITALAGPVYKKLPQPVYREQSSLVVLLDLSQSMNATDIKASRLSRAKLELLDLLKTRKSGQTALVVYAADAFVVTPLTDDNATIANLVPSLETDMMPAQGSNLANALKKAASLFTQSGTIHGDILVITDDIHPRDESAIKKMASQGHRVSIFGIGTAAGSPIPLADGGFLQDNNGAIVLPRLDSARLQSYALSGGGLYTALRANDSDVEKLAKLFQSTEVTKDENSDELNNLSADVWQEEGHWLLLPLAFFAALWARKGWIAALILFISSTAGPLPPSLYADTSRPLLDTGHLWISPDQKAMRAFNDGDSETAAREFTQPDWKASAYYRNGDYESAIAALENTQSSDGFYNKANALARLGRYEEAIKAYDKALELDENNSDAQYNREQVKQALQEQQQQGDQQQESEDQESKDQGNKEQESQQQNGQQQDAQKQDGKQQNQQQDSEQPSDRNESEQQQSSQGKPQENDEQNNKQQEQQQLKQRDAEAEAEQQKKEQQQYQQEQQQRQQEKQEQSEAEASQNQEVEHKDSEEKPMDIEVNPMEASITEQEKATQQWLKRIPDDPGGLLRRKFHYQYKQIPNQTDSEQPW